MPLVFSIIIIFFLSAPLAKAAEDTDSDPASASTSDDNSKTKSEPPAGECAVEKNGDSNFIDDVHGYFNESFCEPAVWFDSFFSNERIDDEVRPGSNLRWQNDYIKDEFGVSKYTTKFRGSFKLPKGSKNLRVVFEGDPEDSVDDIVPSTVNESESRIGIIYELTRSPRANLSWRLSLTPSLTMRYRYSLPITEQITTSFTQQVFYKDSAFGVSAEVDFVHSFSEDLILRQANQIGRTEDDVTSTWSTGLVLFQRINNKSALSYESSYSGVTDPEVFATNARIGVRYRSQIYRKWLYYELAPEVTWPREFITDKRKKTKAMFFRLEINFVNL